MCGIISLPLDVKETVDIPVKMANGSDSTVTLLCSEYNHSETERAVIGIDIRNIFKSGEPLQIQELNIPSEYDNHKIVAVKASAFGGDYDFLISDTNKTKYTSDDFLCKVPYTIGALILSEGITDIEEFAFEDTDIKNVLWPASCKEIKDGTFKKCKLRTINNTDSVEKIGKEAFAHCHQFKKVLKFPSCTSIGKEAFENCIILEKFVWPEKCGTVPEKCFNCCFSLTTVLNMEYAKVLEKKAFFQCGIKTFTISSDCTDIGASCFAYCKSLQYIDWNNSSAAISERCFTNCLNLIKVQNINNVSVVENRAFANTKLPEFIWPEKCNAIPKECFSGSKLKTFIVSPVISSIEEGAFKGCAKLKELDLTKCDYLFVVLKSIVPSTTKLLLPVYAVES